MRSLTQRWATNGNARSERRAEERSVRLPCDRRNSSVDVREGKPCACSTSRQTWRCVRISTRQAGESSAAAGFFAHESTGRTTSPVTTTTITPFREALDLDPNVGQAHVMLEGPMLPTACLVEPSRSSSAPSLSLEARPDVRRRYSSYASRSWLSRPTKYAAIAAVT